MSQQASATLGTLRRSGLCVRAGSHADLSPMHFVGLVPLLVRLHVVRDRPTSQPRASSTRMVCGLLQQRSKVVVSLINSDRKVNYPYISGNCSTPGSGWR